MIKIIGLGSPHGDDQAGWEVIRQLQQDPLPDSVVCEILDRPGPALSNYLQDCDLAILIDACDAGWLPGQWQRFTLAELLASAEPQAGSSHQLGVADSLALATLTGQPLPQISAYAVQIAGCALMAPVSPQISQQVSVIAGQIRQQTRAALAD